MITLEQPPVPPTVTVSGGDTLHSSHALYYQWYFNGFPVFGAMDSFYVALSAGTYSVQVTDSLGCSAISGGLIILGISPLSFEEELGVRPNPARDEFTVYGLPANISGEATLEIFNVFGERVYWRLIEAGSNKPEIINCKSFPTGVYFVVIKDEQSRLVKKVMVE